MITRSEFAAIDAEIRKAMQETLDNIKDTSHRDYFLFLSDKAYKKDMIRR